MTGRKRVWAAFQGSPLDRPPKGEILITPEIVKDFSCPDLETVLAYLNTDLVVLPIQPSGGLYKGLSPDVIKAAYDVVTTWRYDRHE